MLKQKVSKKKTNKKAVVGQARIEAQLEAKYQRALKYYSLTGSIFVRMCIAALVDSHHTKKEVRLPIRFKANRRTNPID